MAQGVLKNQVGHLVQVDLVHQQDQVDHLGQVVQKALQLHSPLGLDYLQDQLALAVQVHQEDLAAQVAQEVLADQAGPLTLVVQRGQVNLGDQLYQMVFFLVLRLYQGFPRFQASHYQVGQRGLLANQG